MSASDENIQQNPEQNSENTDLSRIASQSRISHYTDTGYKGETYTVRYRNKMYQNNNNLLVNLSNYQTGMKYFHLTSPWAGLV